MRRLNLLATEVDSVLFHGLNNVGKTHLLGSIMAYEKQYGPTVYVNMRGEPINSLLSSDLEEVDLVEIAKVDEIPELCRTLIDRHKKVHCITLDSVQRLGELAADKVTGGAYAVGAKEDHGKDWNKLKFEIFKGLNLLIGISKVFVAVCPTRLHENQITHAVRAIPDVPGCGETIQSRFNFVGYIEATVVGPSKVMRKVDFEPRIDVLTRFNGKRSIGKSLSIDNGPFCWEPVKEEMEKAIIGA